MNISKLCCSIYILVFFICIGNNVYAKTIPERMLPVPNTASHQLQSLIAAGDFSWWNIHPGNEKQWKILVDQIASQSMAGVKEARKKMNVTSHKKGLGGVPVFHIAPSAIAPENRNRVLLHLHGGGYVLNPGEAGTHEAVLMAGYGNISVISVDYRMAPEHPYPAALDDALSVYKELLKTHAPEKIGFFGTSAGGGLLLALVHRAKAEGLPLPGAIAPGTPWTDLSKTGDSYYTNAGVDNVLVSYDGWIKDAAQIYANGQDLKHPYISPVYGDVKGFPPTLLTSGTRDLFLSNTVRMHQKLRQADVSADLIIFEGMSHAQYDMIYNAPETIFYFIELKKFFDRNLDK